MFTQILMFIQIDAREEIDNKEIMNKEELKEDFPQGLIIHDGKYFPKMLFPQLPLPKGIFKNEKK